MRTGKWTGRWGLYVGLLVAGCGSDGGSISGARDVGGPDIGRRDVGSADSGGAPDSGGGMPVDAADTAPDSGALDSATADLDSGPRHDGGPLGDAGSAVSDSGADSGTMRDSGRPTPDSGTDAGPDAYVDLGTVTLSVSPSSFQTWATYDIMYFTVTCTWSSGVPDPDCNRAGTPQWTTDYGWFESDRRGTMERGTLQVMPEGQRPRAWSGQTVLWSSSFNLYQNESGTVRVAYGGATAQARVSAYNAGASPFDLTNPLPVNFLVDHPGHPRISPGTLTDIWAWMYTNDIQSAAYRSSRTNQARAVSDRLEDYVRRWARGEVPAEIPDEVWGDAWLLDLENRWMLVHPDDFDPLEHWGIRPRKYDHDPERDGVTTLFPDYNVTYVRADYVAPFDSTLVLEGYFPRARYHSFAASPPFDPRYPAGTSMGAPEIPLLDADIDPEPGSINPYRVYRADGRRGSGPCASYRDGDRSAPNECRRYTVRFIHREGNAVDLNEQLNPGSMTEEADAQGNTLRSRGPNTNVRYVGGLRSGGGATAGELLPAQLWIRTYVPDEGTDVYGDVPLPRMYLELETGEQFMIVARRDPRTGDVMRDQIYRRLNGPFPADAWITFDGDPANTEWHEGVGWKKVFGIVRSVLEDVQLSPDPLGNVLTNFQIRETDRRALGRGVDMGTTGALEASATTAPAVHYLNRYMTIGRGHVAVVFARKWDTPRTRFGDRYMTGGDVRYFSFTRYFFTGPDPNNLLNAVLPAGAFGTVYDEELLTIDSGPCAGWYMLAYSREEDRPSNATAANRVTWQDWTDRATQDIVMRVFTIGPEWDTPQSPSTSTMPWRETDFAEPTFDETIMFRNTQEGARMGEHQMLVAYLTTEEFEALGNGFGPRQLLPYTRNWGRFPRFGVPAPRIVGACGQ